MAIQIFVKKKIKGKRKKYKSFEEMPDDLRHALERTMTNTDPETQKGTESTIVINGEEYNKIEEMPPDIRVIYEKMITSLKKGKMAHDSVSLAAKGISSANINNQSIPYAGPVSIEPQSSFSSFPRWLIIGAVLLAVFMGLYVVMRAVG
jgi:hypothetical protein